MSEDLLPSQLLPLLTVASGPLRGASFRLRPGVRTVGREVGVDVLIDDPKVSRRHATVELVDGRALLADVGSTNGTWLNDRPLSGVAELCDGDRIRLGGVQLRFYDPAAATTEPVGTFGYARFSPSGDTARSSAARVLAEPTQAISTRPRLRRILLLVAGAAPVLGALAWMLIN